MRIKSKSVDDILLRDYIDIRFAAIEKSIQSEHELHDARFQHVDKSTTLAKDTVDKRLESMNAFREQYNELVTRLPTRVEVDEKLKTLLAIEDAYETRIQSLEKSVANFEGRVITATGCVGVISILVSIALHYLK